MLRFWRCSALALLLLAGVAYDTPSVGQQSNDIAALQAQISRLRDQGKYFEAIPLAERGLALVRQRFGEQHTEFAVAAAWLAVLYRAQGRYGEAELLHRHSLAIWEKALGPEHPEVGQSLNNLAFLNKAQGRYAEAESMYRRSLDISEKALGPWHPQVANSLNNLADLHRTQGRYGEAEPYYRRSLEIIEKALGPNDLDVATLLHNLAELYENQGRYGEAEPLYRRGLAIIEKALGPEHRSVGDALNNLALLYHSQSRYTEAEPLFRRSLAIREKALGPEHAHVGASLSNLANVYQQQGRVREAEPLYRRSLAIIEKAQGPDHPDVATVLNSLAVLYNKQGRLGEAEPLYRRSLAIIEKALGPEHAYVGASLGNLANLYQEWGRFREAEQLYRRSLALREKALGPEHPDVAVELHSLATLYQKQGRYGEAGPLHRRGLEIREKVLGPDHAFVGDSLSNMAWLAVDQHDWSRAADYLRRSGGVIVRRAESGLIEAQVSAGRSDAEQSSARFWGLVKVVHRLTMERRITEIAGIRETFSTAQLAQSSEVAASLAQMAVRSARTSGALGGVARERQDLVAEWQRRDAAHVAAVSQPPAKRDRAAETANTKRMTEIVARLATIDKRLATEFPDYAALARPSALSFEEVQVSLAADEALVVFLDTPEVKPTLPEESFAWVVTKSEVRWVRSELGTKALEREVASLRCGLDATNWIDPSRWPETTAEEKQQKSEQESRRRRCIDLTGITSAAASNLPFDLARSHALYKGLFGRIEDLIKGKNLIVVPSGPLTQLPFQVLVTAPSKSHDYKSAAWLVRDHALTVLPAVSSIKALRRVVKRTAATRPMIGFGNPLLDGDQNHSQFGGYYKHQAALARAQKGCAQTVSQRSATMRGISRSLTPMTQLKGLVDVAQVRRQMPLPETADELCAVARDLNTDLTAIRLGARATEREAKRLSAATDATRLANYRIVHFATHGTLAGQLRGTSEPGLILTPPETASEEDDGYLSASEIAGLKLDADWVILSACNTAAGGEKGAEALSGLARAFFYAGARAMLVSHWEVDSDATVKLVTSAVGALARDRSLGRSEALRRAMMAIINGGSASEAHPAIWAPFVVVGEGGAGR